MIPPLPGLFGVSGDLQLHVGDSGCGVCAGMGSVLRKDCVCLYGDGICDGPLSQITKVKKIIFYVAEAK